MALPIEKVMTQDARSIDVGETLEVARDTMRRFDIRHLPVTRDGKLIGILSKHLVDLALVLVEDGRYRLELEDVMIKDPWIVEPGTPLDQVLDKMADDRIGSVLVAEKGELVGIFTATDACRELSKAVSKGSREVS